MTESAATVQPTAAHHDQAADPRAGATSPTWLVALARSGYAARGVVYIIVGAMAILAAWGGGGQTTGSKGALASVLDTTYGWIIVAVLSLGLLGYAVWRFFQGALDADDHGSDAKALTIRAGLFVSSITHLALAAWAGFKAYSYATGESIGMGGASGGGASGGGGGTSGGGGQSESLAAWLMSQPAGVWLVGLVGAAIIGAGIAQFVKGYKANFEKHFDIDYRKLPKVRPMCRFGLMARGVVFFIIGGFFIYAAYTHNPDQAGGLAQALDEIREQTYGTVLLGLTALGLLAFGGYSLIEAVYRRVTYKP